MLSVVYRSKLNFTCLVTLPSGYVILSLVFSYKTFSTYYHDFVTDDLNIIDRHFHSWLNFFHRFFKRKVLKMPEKNRPASLLAGGVHTLRTLFVLRVRALPR